MVIKQHSLEKSNNVYREKNYWPYFHSGPRMKCTLYFFLSFRKCYDNYLNFLCLKTLSIIQFLAFLYAKINRKILQTPSIDNKKPEIYKRITSNHIKHKTCVLLRNSATKEFN